ncbi:MAG: CBS domain-containing protein [bacterium]|nr:CBS domain-containing protein [bacterium]
MSDKLSTILQSKGPTVHNIAPTATVLDAVRKMNSERIGCLLVQNESQVVGIFTERDVLIRVVDAGRDPSNTRVEEVMTEDPVAVGPATTVEEAMAVISERRCRHLPVIEGEQLVGLISIGDLTQWATRNQAFHIQDLVNYITGKYPA